MIDVHDTTDQREPGQVVPDGTFVKLKMEYKDGGYDFGFEEAQFLADKALFSHKRDWQQGDPITLQCDYTIVEGQYRGARLTNYQTVGGGELDNSGISKGWAITKRAICGWLNSATGLDPKDESPQSRSIRQFPNFRALNGIEFWARLGVEEGGVAPDGGNYPDKNFIAHIVEANDPEYAPLRSGQLVESKPGGVRRRRGGNTATAQQAPAGNAAWNAGYTPPQPQQQPQPQGWAAQAAPAASPGQGWGGSSAVSTPAAVTQGWQNGAAPPAQMSAGQSAPLPPNSARPSWVRN